MQHSVGSRGDPGVTWRSFVHCERIGAPLALKPSAMSAARPVPSVPLPSTAASGLPVAPGLAARPAVYATDEAAAAGEHAASLPPRPSHSPPTGCQFLLQHPTTLHLPRKLPYAYHHLLLWPRRMSAPQVRRQWLPVCRPPWPCRHPLRGDLLHSSPEHQCWPMPASRVPWPRLTSVRRLTRARLQSKRSKCTQSCKTAATQAKAPSALYRCRTRLVVGKRPPRSGFSSTSHEWLRLAVSKHTQRPL